MRRTVAAGGVAALLAVGAVATTTYIDADGGGKVYEYVAKYDEAYRRGDKIVVRGRCYSSCTVALAYPNACLMPSAELGFHPAYVPYLWLGGLAHYYIDPAATAVMRRHYPADALAVIDARRGMTNKGGWFAPAITLIDADDFPRRYLCADSDRG